MKSSRWVCKMWLLLMWFILVAAAASELQPSLRHPRALLQKDLARGSATGGSPKAVYDKCSHPFHSWQCPQNRQNRPQASAVFPSVLNPPTVPPPPRPPQPTTAPPPFREGGGLFPDSAPSNGGFVDSLPFPASPRPPPLPTIPPPQSTTPYDKCSHPFHSWLCQKPQRPRTTTPRSGGDIFPDASFNDGVESLPDAIPLPSTTPPPPPAPPTTPKEYDKCSHPFHSWLCRAAPRPRPTLPPPLPKPTTKAPSGSEIFPEASFQQPGSQLFPEALPSPPSTTPFPPATTPYDKCSHPLHSWRCQKPPKTTTTEKPFASGGLLDAEPANQQSGAQLPFPVNQTPPPSTPKPSWEGADPCFHAFHSWLCKPPRITLTSPVVRRPPIPPTTPRAKLLDPEASFQEPESILFPGNSVTTTTTPPPSPPPITLPPPPPLTTIPPPAEGTFADSEPDVRQEPAAVPEPQPEPEPTLEDICNHPFHSFLCQKLSPRKQWSKPTERRQPTTTTTIPPPPPPPPVEEEPAASFLEPDSQPKVLDGKGDFSDALPQPATTPSPKYDKCSHPFHSWLCQAAPGRSRIRTSSVNSVNFLIGAKSLPSIQNLPLEAHSPPEGTSNSAKSLGSASDFNHGQLNKNSFGNVKDSRLGEPSVNFPASDFTPTVPTVPKFIPTIPTIPSFGLGALSNHNSIPTVPTVPTVPMVPTVSPFIPTVPTVPTVPRVPLNIHADTFLAEESAPVPSFSLPNDLPLQFTKNERVPKESDIPAVSTVNHSFPRGYPAIFVASPSTVHRITAIQALPHSPSPMLPSISSLPSPPPSREISSSDIPRPTLPPPTSTQPSQSLSTTQPDFSTTYPPASTSSHIPDFPSSLSTNFSTSTPPFTPSSQETEPPAAKQASLSPTLPASDSESSSSEISETHVLSLQETLSLTSSDLPLQSTSSSSTASLSPATIHSLSSPTPSSDVSNFSHVPNTSQSKLLQVPLSSSILAENSPVATSPPPSSLSPVISVSNTASTSQSNPSLAPITSTVPKENSPWASSPPSTPPSPVTSISNITSESPSRPSTSFPYTSSTTFSPSVSSDIFQSTFEVPADLTASTSIPDTHEIPPVRRPTHTRSSSPSESSHEQSASSFPVLFHPPPPPSPPRPPLRSRTLGMSPPPPPPPPPSLPSPLHHGSSQLNTSPDSHELELNFGTTRKSRRPTHRQVRPPPLPRLPFLQPGSALSFSAGGPLVASGSSHSVVTLTLPDHQVPLEVLEWEPQRTVPRKRYNI